MYKILIVKKIDKKIYFLFILWLLFFVSCLPNNDKKDIVEIDFGDTSVIISPKNDEIFRKISVAIATTTSPSEDYDYYEALIKIISNRLGAPIDIKYKKTYAEINKMLEAGQIDFAFVDSYAYVELERKHIAKLLAVPVLRNGKTFKSYVISSMKSHVHKFDDLKSKKIAYTDPLSLTGRIYALNKVKQMGFSEKNYFDKIIFTYGNDISIQMVNQGLIDGAVVHGLIFDYLSLKYPERTKNIKIVEKSEEYPVPPVVVPVTISKKLYQNLKEILLELHQSVEGEDALEKLSFEKFVNGEKLYYQTVFNLNSFVHYEN